MGLVDLPARSTLIRFGLQAKTILISPLPTMSEDQMRELGPVDVIIAPNLFHHMGLKRALRVWPTAELWGPKGLSLKRTDLKFTGLFDFDRTDLISSEGEYSWPHSDCLRIFPVLGADRFQEVAIYVASAKTLIVTDLIFNLKTVSGFKAKIIFGLLGTYRKLAYSRLFQFLISDRKKIGTALASIAKLEVKTLIMAHGSVVENLPAGAIQTLFRGFISRGQK